MVAFLLLLILIVMLGALGWLMPVVRVLAFIAVIIGGLFSLFLYFASQSDNRPDYEKIADSPAAKAEQQDRMKLYDEWVDNLGTKKDKGETFDQFLARKRKSIH